MNLTPRSFDRNALKHISDETQDDLNGELLEDSAPLSYEETETKVDELWSAGDRYGAMEVVLGRPIYSEDLDANPLLSQIFMLSNANEAFGALLLFKSTEDSKADKINTAE